MTLRDHFLLDRQIVFLNHGSFGATPRPVFERYQAWQRELEDQPVEFLGRRILPLLAEARRDLGEYLGTHRDNLVFIPNTTFGVNVIARSLPLGSGDEILSTDHEYGACENAWKVASSASGAIFRQLPVPLPVSSSDEVLETIWQAVSRHTRVIYLSHITSPTAVRFPIEALCRRARQAGILTVIDGAHAPGQIPLELDELGADFYTGNCHKW